MSWKTKHAAVGAAALIVAMGLFTLIGETGLAMLCWIPAAVLTALYMASGPDEEEL